MAQTKRKRRTKHRGNAAGMVETRGRTGRRPEGAAPASKSRSRSATAQERLNRPPTWRSAINRAGIATAFFAIALILLFKEPIGATLGLAAFVFLMYIPLGYYTDRWMYQRRVAKGLAKPMPPREGKR